MRGWRPTIGDDRYFYFGASCEAALAIEFHGESRISPGFDEVMAEPHFTIRDVGTHTVLATKSLS
jgi:hypothetical protein